MNRCIQVVRLCVWFVPAAIIRHLADGEASEFPSLEDLVAFLPMLVLGGQDYAGVEGWDFVNAVAELLGDDFGDHWRGHGDEIKITSREQMTTMKL